MIKLKNIRWEIESKCNLNCKHCFVHDNTYSNQLSYEEQRNIVKKLHEAGVEEVLFTTMEPLINENIIELIKFCKALGMKTTIVTNGILLENKEFAQNFILSGIDSISISLEGATKESNDAIRGNGTFDKVLKALDNISFYIDKYQKLVTVNIQMTLNIYNSKNCEDIPRLMNNLPIDSLSIGDISEAGNAVINNNIILDSDTYFENCEKIAKSYAELVNKNFILIFKSLTPWETLLLNWTTGSNYDQYLPNCSAMHNTYSLLPDGRIVPCISLLKNFDQEVSITINDLDKIDTMFDSYLYDLKKQVRDIQLDCKECYFYEQCLPCPVHIYNIGQRNKLFHRCKKSSMKIDALINASENNSLYNFELDNTKILLENQQVTFTKYYNDGRHKNKTYEINNRGKEVITSLLANMKRNKEHVSYLPNDEKILEFLTPLIYEGFIKIVEV